VDPGNFRVVGDFVAVVSRGAAPVPDLFPRIHPVVLHLLGQLPEVRVRVLPDDVLARAVVDDLCEVWRCGDCLKSRHTGLERGHVRLQRADLRVGEVQLARELRLTLIGFLRGRRFVIYSGEERIAGSKQPDE